LDDSEVKLAVELTGFHVWRWITCAFCVGKLVYQDGMVLYQCTVYFEI